MSENKKNVLIISSSRRPDSNSPALCEEAELELGKSIVRPVR